MELSFDDFKGRASDAALSPWEKVGFPDAYRRGLEPLIVQDIVAKTQWTAGARVLDIGCGCSPLVAELMAFAQLTGSQLCLNDSAEMLDQVPSNDVEKWPGRFPFLPNIEAQKATFDVIIAYSVLQYVFLEQSLFKFIHQCIHLLKPNGRLLIGDIPNLSARNRFLNSTDGQAFAHNQIALNSSVAFDHTVEERLDDSLVLSILARFRNFQCETYLLPQMPPLPFANRREDILIVKRS